MALQRLSLVTLCFKTLLESRIPTFSEWTGGTLTVSAGPPDLVNGANTLSFYLYHVREDAHTKSQDWPVNDPVPQRYKSMGLTLYYVLTPRSNLGDSHLRALNDQVMMGFALKTMRDTPYIDDTTSVDSTGGPVLVMPTGMRALGNRLRSLLQPTPPNEAIQYWQAGTGAARLAAYYEVAATLLEPDEPQSRRGRVLMVGVNTVTRGQPRIERTVNTISFTPPGALDPRQLEISPAEVPYGEILEIDGADLKGDTQGLLINHRDFLAPIEVDAPWTIATDGSTLTVKVQPSIGAQVILPGIYGATVRTTARVRLPDGTSRDFDSFSNESAFALAPAITGVAGPGPVLTVTVDGFQPAALVKTDFMVFAGPTRLTRVAAGPPAAGEFYTPPGVQTFDFRFPAGLTAGSMMPLRIVARGAESGPRWEAVP